MWTKSFFSLKLQATSILKWKRGYLSSKDLKLANLPLLLGKPRIWCLVFFPSLSKEWKKDRGTYSFDDLISSSLTIWKLESSTGIVHNDKKDIIAFLLEFFSSTHPQLVYEVTSKVTLYICPCIQYFQLAQSLYLNKSTL